MSSIQRIGAFFDGTGNDENSDLLIYGDNDKITFTDTDGTYQEFLKDSNGNIYTSIESNDNFTISYDNTKTVTNIEITGDNVSLDDVSNLTEYSKEDLKAFNILDSDTLTKGTNIQQPISKTVYEGNITQYDTKDGNSIFIVPNSDVTSTTYGTFTDGFENQAAYEKSSNGSMNIAFTNIDDNNLLLNTLFCLTSSLQRENLYSLSLLSSHKILSSSLELEKNKVSNNEFYGMREVA